MAVCEVHGCGVELTHGNTTGLCYVCSSALAHDANDLEKELSVHLERDAQFAAYCRAHGLPNPHE